MLCVTPIHSMLNLNFDNFTDDTVSESAITDEVVLEVESSEIHGNAFAVCITMNLLYIEFLVVALLYNAIIHDSNNNCKLS